MWYRKSKCLCLFFFFVFYHFSTSVPQIPVTLQDTVRIAGQVLVLDASRLSSKEFTNCHTTRHRYGRWHSGHDESGHEHVKSQETLVMNGERFHICTAFISLRLHTSGIKFYFLLSRITDSVLFWNEKSFF